MRKYRIGPDGQERPIWASKGKLRALGMQEGRQAFLDGRLPVLLSNVTHDKAALDEYERLKGQQHKN